MLSYLSETHAFTGKKQISISYLVNPTSYFVAVLLAIIISSSLFAVQAASLTADIESIENKLTVWLKHQQIQNHSPMVIQSNPPAPTSTDLRALAMNWQRLSAGFKKLYLESQEIPSGFAMYTTPRFGIELYYTLSGTDAVDTTDTLSPSAENCCVFNVKPNGTPDYIDLTAGALDSAWQMEVVRFGFPAPKPYISPTHSTSAFKVVVKSLSAHYYGLTFPLENQNDSGTGISSIITMRNSWTGWDIDGLTDYQTSPEKAIRITCAHELFHAIQYRMVHTVVEDIHLDELPVSWVEGSAGMMEELAFPDINDFLQYAKTYFTDPASFSVFSSTSDNSSYANVLVCLYLYGNYASGNNSIGFFTSVFFDNMTISSSFKQLLGAASAKVNRNWVDILNSFHTASFYTGQRSVDGRFIADAQKMTEWNYTAGEGMLSGRVEKTIKPFSMQYCSLVNIDHRDMTLSARIILPGARNPGNYAGRIILRNSTGVDSVVPFAPRLSDTGKVTVEKWSLWDEALVIVTNGTDSANLSVKFEFSTEPATHIPSPHSPDPLHRPYRIIFTTLDGRILALPQKKALASRHSEISAGIYIMKEKTVRTVTAIGR